MWHYSRDGEQKGPVSERELKDLLQKNDISPETLIWEQGMPEWQPLRDTRLAPLWQTALPEGDEWLVCAYSGDRHRRSEMVPFGAFWVATAHKDEVVDFIKQGGVLPKADNADDAKGDISLGWTMASAWDMTVQDGRMLAIIFLTLWVPANFLSNWMDVHVFGDDQPMRSFQFYQLLYLFFGNLFAGVAYSAFWNRTRGRPLFWTEALGGGVTCFLKLVGVSLLTGLMFFAGFILFIIPGVIVLVRLYLASALAVERNLPVTSAIQASWDLTRGYFWYVAGCFLLVSTIVSLPVIALEMTIASVPWVPEPLIYSVMQSVLALGDIYLLAFTVCYLRELRVHKRKRNEL